MKTTKTAILRRHMNDEGVHIFQNDRRRKIRTLDDVDEFPKIQPPCILRMNLSLH